tara:strand:+ start:539 stop:787 length:249 start_codon:yes stop_codon:yes gene_type:complete
MNPNINAPPQQHAQVDLTHATDIVCDGCQNTVFQLGCFIKRLSEVVSPTGKEMIVPVQTLQCTSCGHINEEFRPQEFNVTET